MNKLFLIRLGDVNRPEAPKNLYFHYENMRRGDLKKMLTFQMHQAW